MGRSSVGSTCTTTSSASASSTTARRITIRWLLTIAARIACFRRAFVCFGSPPATYVAILGPWSGRCARCLMRVLPAEIVLPRGPYETLPAQPRKGARPRESQLDPGRHLHRRHELEEQPAPAIGGIEQRPVPRPLEHLHPHAPALASIPLQHVAALGHHR